MLQQSFYILFLLSILRLPATTRCGGDGGNTDADALLAFKSEADLDNKLRYTTNDRFNYCQWRGVKCAHSRVVRYVIQSYGLRGTVGGSTLSRLDQLRVLIISNNSLFGPVPDFSPLVNLKTLVLDRNYFSGSFPFPILSLRRLSVLDFSHNNFTGSLPENLTLLDQLGYLHLDSNWFYGSIPPLNQTMLEDFNVSHNNLTGPIPVTPTLKKFKISSFLHNTNLCGKIIQKPCRMSPFFNLSSAADGGGTTAIASPPSPLLQSQQGLSAISPPAQRNHHKNVGFILGFVIGTLMLIAAILSLMAIFRKRREENETEHLEAKEETLSSAPRDTTLFSISPEPENPNSENHQSKKLKSPLQKRILKSGSLVFCSGEEELYTLEQLMRASAELLGRGSFGTTYRAVMASRFVVCVKRLDACKTAITNGDAFEKHMETVGMLRHPNLVPLRAYFQAKQERLIVFDYQPNGSLLNLIHDSRTSKSKPLPFTTCLKIAEDIAQGLAYIHQASKFIHGNLKPSNILLGPDLEACLVDYCLSILADTSECENPESNGYKAPETGKSGDGPATKSDVYAFGVVLLELLSGVPPYQHPFLAPPDMTHWVRAMRGDDDVDETRLGMFVEVACICSLKLVEKRPTMWQVLKMIANLKDVSSSELQR